MVMFELRIDIFDNSNIIWSLYCEPAPLFTLQAQAPTPSIYLHTHIVWAFTEEFQTFSQGLTYIPGKRSFQVVLFGFYKNLKHEFPNVPSMPCVSFNARSLLYLFKSGLLVVCFSDPSDGVDPTGVRRGGVLSRQFCQPAQHGGLHPG